MTKLLIAYHSHDGQTTKIAGHLALRLRERRLDVDEFEARHAPPPDGYDVAVVGDSIRLGRHSRQLTRYLRRHREALGRVPVALFQVSMTSAGHDTEHAAESDRLLRQLVERTGLQPARTAARCTSALLLRRTSGRPAANSNRRRCCGLSSRLSS